MYNYMCNQYVFFCYAADICWEHFLRNVPRKERQREEHNDEGCRSGERRMKTSPCVKKEDMIGLMINARLVVTTELRLSWKLASENIGFETWCRYHQTTHSNEEWKGHISSTRDVRDGKKFFQNASLPLEIKAPLTRTPRLPQKLAQPPLVGP